MQRKRRWIGHTIRRCKLVFLDHLLISFCQSPCVSEIDRVVCFPDYQTIQIIIQILALTYLVTRMIICYAETYCFVNPLYQLFKVTCILICLAFENLLCIDNPLGLFVFKIMLRNMLEFIKKNHTIYRKPAEIYSYAE